MMEKQKKNFKYKETKSETGQLHVHINQKLSARIADYCKRTNQNKTRFVETCVREVLEKAERKYYEQLSHEEVLDEFIKYLFE